MKKANLTPLYFSLSAIPSIFLAAYGIFIMFKLKLMNKGGNDMLFGSPKAGTDTERIENKAGEDDSIVK